MEEAQFAGLPAGSGQLAANDSSSSGQDGEHPNTDLNRALKSCALLLQKWESLSPQPPLSIAVFIWYLS